MFKSARLKLTAWYLLIIGCVSVSFSAVIFRMLSLEIDRFARVQQLRMLQNYQGVVILPGGEIQQVQENPQVDLDLVAETKNRLALYLVLINGVILVSAGGLGYLLAGKTLQPIKLMVEEQNQFISDASHELRTPLTSLKSAMEVNLRDKKLTLKDAKILISENIQEVNKLQSLSDSLLSLAQFQKPNGQIKFEKINLTEVVSKAIHKVSPVAEMKNVSISQNEDAPVEVEGSAYSLTDLIVIFMDNAVKYSHEGGKIQVETKKIDGSATISIKDEGIGIDPEDQVHIFDRFYRGDAARSKQDVGGYGLGLAIAKKIVEKHHGNISVDSTPGKGSTFTVKLPIKQRFS